MIESSKLYEVVFVIRNNFNPDKIMLFGTHTNRSAYNDSDLELLLIEATEFSKQTRRSIKDNTISLDKVSDRKPYSDNFTKQMIEQNYTSIDAF